MRSHRQNGHTPFDSRNQTSLPAHRIAGFRTPARIIISERLDLTHVGDLGETHLQLEVAEVEFFLINRILDGVPKVNDLHFVDFFAWEIM